MNDHARVVRIFTPLDQRLLIREFALWIEVHDFDELGGRELVSVHPFEQRADRRGKEENQLVDLVIGNLSPLAHCLSSRSMARSGGP